MTKIAILLSGCGNKDGSEIHEASICMSSLQVLDPSMKLVCTSIDKPQHEVINFITGKPTSLSRNILEESARIARGDIHRCSELDPSDLDALVIIGGLGAIKNLTNFFIPESSMEVDHEVNNLLVSLWKLKKPIGAICIAPLILARVISSVSDTTPTITLGEQDSSVSDLAEQFGAKLVRVGSDSIVVDEKNRLVTTPAFMNPGNLADIYPGIKKLAEKILNF